MTLVQKRGGVQFKAMSLVDLPHPLMPDTIEWSNPVIVALLTWLFTWFIGRVGRSQTVAIAKRTIYQRVVDRVISPEKLKRTADQITGSVAKEIPGVPMMMELPRQGHSKEQVIQQLDKMQAFEQQAADLAKLSGTVYRDDEILKELAVASYERFLHANPLHPDVFPAVRQMEASVVSMVARLFSQHAQQPAVGTMTMGGTESIILACYGYVHWFRQRSGMTAEVVACDTVHAAFDKAASMMGFKLVKIPVDPHTGTCAVSEYKRHITWNTAFLVASSPAYSTGIIDNVLGIAQLAHSRGIGCHVDSCLGSFMTPLMPHLIPTEQLPKGLERGVGFHIPGVTSISVDPHKVKIQFVIP